MNERTTAIIEEMKEIESNVKRLKAELELFIKGIDRLENYTATEWDARNMRNIEETARELRLELEKHALLERIAFPED